MNEIDDLRQTYTTRYRRELEVLASMVENELSSIREPGFRHTQSLGSVCRQVTELCYMMKALDDVERRKG